MMPLHYNRTAVVDGTASVHHRLAFMMGCFMDCRAVMDRAAFVYSRSVMSGTAFVHHRLCLVLWCFMYSRPVMGRAALVHHRLRLVMLCAPVHAGTLMFGNVLMHGRTVMGGAALVHHRLRLVMLCASVHAGTLLFGNVLMNRRALMSGIASMHGRSCLMAGTAFMYRPDLLCLCGTLSAGMTGRRRFRNSHQERGTEETCHQCDCQYFL